MADKLIVKNFGPIIDAELEIKKTTVFIGPQGSGKSTLAKLVAIFRDIKTLHLGTPDNDDIKSNFDFYLLKNFFNLDSTIKYVSRNYTISYENEHFNKLDKELVDKVKNTVSLSEQQRIASEVESLNQIIENHKKNGVFNTDENIFKKRVLAIIENSLFDSLIKGVKLNLIYIPAERMFYSTISDSLLGLINSDVALPKFFTSFGNEFEKARKSLAYLYIDFLEITFQYKDKQNKILLGEKSILLSESASGFQSIIPLLVVIEAICINEEQSKEEGFAINSSFFDHTFIIEEPELNLYPTTQKGLIYSLAKSCTKGNNELLMTTHSPYILAALNNLIFAYKTAQKHPEKADEVAKIVPRASWLNPEEFAAYFVADGSARSIIDHETGMISENELDGVSDLIGDEFDALMRIYRIKEHEAAH